MSELENGDIVILKPNWEKLPAADYFVRRSITFPAKTSSTQRLVGVNFCNLVSIVDATSAKLVPEEVLMKIPNKFNP